MKPQFWLTIKKCVEFGFDVMPCVHLTITAKRFFRQPNCNTKLDNLLGIPRLKVNGNRIALIRKNKCCLFYRLTVGND